MSVFIVKTGIFVGLYALVPIAATVNFVDSRAIKDGPRILYRDYVIGSPKTFHQKH